MIAQIKQKGGVKSISKLLHCIAEYEDHEYLGKVLRAARIIAEQEGISEKGYRLVFNNNRDGGQTVDYLHCHLIGGRPLGWPPG